MGTLTSTIGSIAQFASPLLRANQKSASANVQYQQAQQDAALKRQQNLLTYQNAETDRLQKLRKAVASERANAGYSGVADGAGSSEAVLQGLNENSDITRQQNKASFDLTNRSINQSLSQAQQSNLLTRQQLQQNVALSAITDNF